MHNSCLKHNFYRDPPSRIKFWILSRLFCCRKIMSWKKIARCFGTNSTRLWRFPLFAALTKPNPLFLARWDWTDDPSSSQCVDFMLEFICLLEFYYLYFYLYSWDILEAWCLHVDTQSSLKGINIEGCKIPIGFEPINKRNTRL